MSDNDKNNKISPNQKPEAPVFDLSSAPALIRKPIEWFKNYWYYYKMYFILITPIVIVLIVLITSMASKNSYDYTVVFTSEFIAETEDLDQISKNLSQYLGDVNNDKKLDIDVSELTLREDLSDEYFAYNYNKLSQMMVFDEVVFFIADGYSYEYLKSRGFIEPFSVIGAGESDEYDLLISETPLLEGTKIKNYTQWHLLVKVKSEISAENKEYKARRSGVASMIEALKTK